MSIFYSYTKLNSKSVAVIDDENNKYKYSDLISFKNVFKSKIPERSLVFCLCKNNIESLIGYFSFLENKIVPLLLDADINADLLYHLVNTYKPNYIWKMLDYWAVKGVFLSISCYDFRLNVAIF